MVYVPKTCYERVAKIIDFFPHDYLVLALSYTDVARHPIEDLAEAVKKTSPLSPFPIGEEQLRDIRSL